LQLDAAPPMTDFSDVHPTKKVCYSLISAHSLNHSSIAATLLELLPSQLQQSLCLQHTHTHTHTHHHHHKIASDKRTSIDTSFSVLWFSIDILYSFSDPRYPPTAQSMLLLLLARIRHPSHLSYLLRHSLCHLSHAFQYRCLSPKIDRPTVRIMFPNSVCPTALRRVFRRGR
jgi:hypothetical protein